MPPSFLIYNSIVAIERLIREGHPLMIAWSSGKDSSTAMNLALTAAVRVLNEHGVTVPLVVTHGDTLIENPEMHAYAKKEMAKVTAFAEKHGLNLQIAVSVPNLNDRWSVQILGGRSIPAFPTSGSGKQNRDCTVDYKVRPMERVRKEIAKGFAVGGNVPVTIIGTRFDESATRSDRMDARGEQDHLAWANEDGDLFLSPIAHWSSDDVWEYLGRCKAGDIPAYSDFVETFRIYADAAGESCAVVADMATGTLKQGKACGARTGCALCTVTDDRSMKNLIEGKPEQYGYMRELNLLQRFILATQYDLDRRLWVGRSINDAGYIAIRADVFSPRMLEELLRYAMTIDVIEMDRADRLGIEPRFQLVDAKSLLAIDAMWSLQGYNKPFAALSIYRDVYVRGERYPVPEIERYPRVTIPAARYLYVGDGWDEGNEFEYAGLRDATQELVSIDSAGCMGIKQLKSGRVVMDINTDQLFDVDEESAGLILGMELDRLLDEQTIGSINQGYLYYLRMGAISIAKGKESMVDTILKRTAFKERKGLCGPDYDIESLLVRTVSEKAMKEGVKIPQIDLATERWKELVLALEGEPEGNGVAFEFAASLEDEEGLPEGNKEVVEPRAVQQMLFAM